MENKMEILIDKNTNIAKEKLIIASLEISIKEDKIKNDTKSLMYHTMALQEHKKFLLKIENNNNPKEVEFCL